MKAIGGDIMLKSVGVIVEYNPFHHGHMYHLTEAKRISEADVLIAVMSGNFLQRGEPALVSKWTRTKMAIAGGADIVVELPYAFATQKAETFAFGAISILDALHCDSYCFGSEAGDTNKIAETIHFLATNREKYEQLVRFYIKKGDSYPTASSKAFFSLDDNRKHLDLSKPNNILGYHYMKAAMQLQSKMNAYTVKRKAAQYNDRHLPAGTIASATSIREKLQTEKNIDVIEQYVPQTTLEELRRYQIKFGLLSNWEHYWPFLQYRLLTADVKEIANIYEMEEGIEYRLKKAAKYANSFQSFMKEVKTKRYTWTRIQRMCVHILTNTTKKEMQQHHEQVSHIRLLGMNKKGQLYLRQVKRHIPIPFISTLSLAPKKTLSLDVRATETYAQCYPEPARTQLIKMEYEMKPI